VKFEKTDSTAKKVKERFMLYPDAFINPKGNESGLSANPDTKHYLDKDVYTFINQATDKSKSDTSQYYNHLVQHVGDTVFINNGYLIYNGFTKEIKNKAYQAAEGDLAVAAKLTLYDLKGPVHELNPVYVVRNKEVIDYVEDTFKQMDLYVRLDNILVKSQDTAYADLKLKQTNPKDDYIVLKTLVFPYINVLWAGVIIMVLGFFISLGRLAGTKTRKEEVLPLPVTSE
jgi:cytochrome c-type biogenesis protein CcmF